MECAGNTSTGRCPGCVLIRCHSHLKSVFQYGGAAAILWPPPGDLPLHSICKGGPRYPAEKTNFSRLYPWSHSFGYYPKLVTMDEGMNVYWEVNWELHLLVISERYSACITAEATLIQLLYFILCFIFPSFLIKSVRQGGIFSSWDRTTNLTQRGNSPLFWLKIIVSEINVPIFI